MTTNSRIHTIVTHTSIHLDEIIAIILLWLFGESRFPGISKARVRLVSQAPCGTDAELEAQGIVLVGFGDRFNDKNADGSRKVGVCSATLVALYLGIGDESPWRPILAEVLKCDSKSGVPVSTLAGIVKGINRTLAGNHTTAITFVQTAVDYLVRQQTCSFVPTGPEKSVLDFFVTVRERLKLFNEHAVGRLTKLFTDSVNNGGSVLELDYIVRAMQRQGMKDKDIVEWLEFAVARLYSDQVAFQRVVDDVRVDDFKRRGKVSHELDVVEGHHDNVRRLRTIVIKSDDPNAHSAASFLGYAICLCLRSDGHVQIFTKPQAKVRLDRVAAMLRWLELPADKKNIPLAELACPGEHKLVPQWHYFEQAEQIFNGSLTHGGVSATKICLSAIEEILECAFHAGKYAGWKTSRDIGNASTKANRSEGSGGVVRKYQDLVDAFSGQRS